MAHYATLTAAAIAAGALFTVCSWLPAAEAFNSLMNVTVDAISGDATPQSPTS